VNRGGISPGSRAKDVVSIRAVENARKNDRLTGALHDRRAAQSALLQ
jgi:hypothetical protein